MHSSSPIPDDRHPGRRFHWQPFLVSLSVACQNLLRSGHPEKEKKDQVGNQKLSRPRITKTCNRFPTNPTQLNHSVGSYRTYSRLFANMILFLLTSSSSLMTHLAPVGREAKYGVWFKLIRGSASYDDLVQRSGLQKCIAASSNWNSINCYR